MPNPITFGDGPSDVGILGRESYLATRDGEVVPVGVSGPLVWTVPYAREFRIYERERRYFQWAPQPDITPHEVALCLPMFIAWTSIGEQYDALPPACRRHWTVCEQEQVLRDHSQAERSDV